MNREEMLARIERHRGPWDFVIPDPIVEMHDDENHPASLVLRIMSVELFDDPYRPSIAFSGLHSHHFAKLQSVACFISAVMSISSRPDRQYSGTTRGAGRGWTGREGRAGRARRRKSCPRRPARSSGRSEG